MGKIKAFIDKVADLFHGETVRFIGYAAGLVAYAVARATALPDIPLDVAINGTAAYVVIVGSIVESIRHFVYSPNSAQDLIDTIQELQAEVDALKGVTGEDAGNLAAASDAVNPVEGQG